ncbi:MAG: cyclic nucleotide-binding domain-containing protein [Betaproteobacteria bacterium]|nr:cyclic nucleotide-binding domain-containing protein [Betaproteobacteria bacterium]
MAEANFDARIKGLSDGQGRFSDQIHAMIERLPMFMKCSREEIEALAAIMKVYQAPPGVALVEEGEHSDFMMVLLEGGVRIVKEDSHHQRKIIASVVGAGTLLGEMSMADGEPRFATCVTTSPTTFAVLTRDSLDRIIQERPALGVRILEQIVKILTQRLRQTGSKFAEYL